MLFVAKCIAYPWNNATRRDKGYYAISSDKTTNQIFWQAYEEQIPSITEEFKDLVNSAVQRAEYRATLTEVLGHPWMKGEILTEE